MPILGDSGAVTRVGRKGGTKVLKSGWEKRRDESFRPAFSPDPTDCPWVSEEGALPSPPQFGRGRLSLVVISFYALSLLFRSCRLSEFTLTGPQKNNSCHPVTLEWFSIQLLVNSKMFKLSLNLSLTHLWAQIVCYELKGDLSQVMHDEIFHDS